MNCELAQRRLLASDAPAQPAPETRRHLAECPACRVWQRRLAHLEQQLALLATPPSQRKADVMRLILESPPPFVSNGTAPAPLSAPRRSMPRPMRERGLRKVSVAIALAAALVVFALGWALVPTLPEARLQADPIAHRRAQRDQLLAGARTAPARVQVLAKLAASAREEALALSQAGDGDVVNAAQFYIELVRDNLPEHAKQVSPGERQVVLGAIAEELRQTDNSIVTLLATPDVKLTNRPALEKMALEARKSRVRLLEMMRGDA